MHLSALLVAGVLALGAAAAPATAVADLAKRCNLIKCNPPFGPADTSYAIVKEKREFEPQV